MGAREIDLESTTCATVLPKPGTREQLDKLVGRLHSSLLDRSRPLWEFTSSTGCRPAPMRRRGRVIIGSTSKVHHASLDGAGGIVLANAMLDTGPLPRQVSAPRARRTPADGAYGIGELAAGARNTGEQFVKLARTLPTLARTLWHRLRPAAGSAAAASTAAGSGPKGDWFAPRTPLNVAITNQRAFASLSLPLAGARQIAKANDATINDVVLAVCSGRCAT